MKMDFFSYYLKTNLASLKLIDENIDRFYVCSKATILSIIVGFRRSSGSLENMKYKVHKNTDPKYYWWDEIGGSQALVDFLLDLAELPFCCLHTPWRFFSSKISSKTGVKVGTYPRPGSWMVSLIQFLSTLSTPTLCSFKRVCNVRFLPLYLRTGQI